MRSVAMICVLLAAGMMGCESASKTAEVPTTRSRALRATVIQVLDDAMARRREAGEQVPTSSTDPEFAKSVADAIAAQFPEAFEVTSFQEKAFQEGICDNGDNAEALAELIAEMKEQNASVNTITSELLRQHADEPLTGLRLELARRLLAAQMAVPAAGDLQAAR